MKPTLKSKVNLTLLNIWDMTINHFSFDIIYITGNPTKSSRLCLQQKKKSNDTPSMVMLRMHKMREQGEKLVISFFYITNLQFYNWFEGIRITCIMLLLCSCGLSMTHHTHTHTHSDLCSGEVTSVFGQNCILL